MPPKDTADAPDAPDLDALLAAAAAHADTALQAVQQVTTAVADIAGHADRAEAAADRAVAAGAASAPTAGGPYLGAIVNVRTADEIDGQRQHAGLVTAVHSPTMINAIVFRTSDPQPVARRSLPFSQDGDDEGDSWCWPAVPVSAVP